MGVLGDKLIELGLQKEEVDKKDRKKQGMKGKLFAIKKHIEDMERLYNKYSQYSGNDAQDEYDILTALSYHFLYMVEGYKDVVQDIAVYNKQPTIDSLRSCIRYFSSEIINSSISNNVNAALDSFRTRNEAAHQYERDEEIAKVNLKNWINFSNEYKSIWALLYEYCLNHDMIKDL